MTQDESCDVNGFAEATHQMHNHGRLGRTDIDCSIRERAIFARGGEKLYRIVQHSQFCTLFLFNVLRLNVSSSCLDYDSY